jgi:hypothetical protein
MKIGQFAQGLEETLLDMGQSHRWLTSGNNEKTEITKMAF